MESFWTGWALKVLHYILPSSGVGPHQCFWGGGVSSKLLLCRLHQDSILFQFHEMLGKVFHWYGVNFDNYIQFYPVFINEVMSSIFFLNISSLWGSGGWGGGKGVRG